MIFPIRRLQSFVVTVRYGGIELKLLSLGLISLFIVSAISCGKNNQKNPSNSFQSFENVKGFEDIEELMHFGENEFGEYGKINLLITRVCGGSDCHSEGSEVVYLQSKEKVIEDRFKIINRVIENDHYFLPGALNKQDKKMLLDFFESI